APRIVPDPPDYDSVADQRGHLNFYVDPNNVHLTDFFFASSKRIDFDEIPNVSSGNAATDVEIAVRRINETGERVYLREVTTPDVKDLGLCVVRAVAPGFQQLHMGFKNRCLGGRRLWEVPQKMGYRGVSPATGDYPAPHPYP
ncbi:MAG: YcaO-like family protein, partial [Bryobacterales bacterium]|nr:YcaO-like family protein [Bryobacterales bacterium]